MMRASPCSYAYSLAFVLVFLVVHSNSYLPRMGEFDYSKISLWWPTSYCDSPRRLCDWAILGYFTIDTLYPMLRGNHIVPPYEEDHECTSGTLPIPTSSIDRQELEVLLPMINEYWPNLDFDNDTEKNIDTLKDKWESQGKCYYPKDPFAYYAKGLYLIRKFNLLSILNVRVPPRRREYFPDDIIEAMKIAKGVRVQLQCNVNKNGDLQLLKIEICYSKDDQLMDCEEEKEVLNISCPRLMRFKFPPAW